MKKIKFSIALVITLILTYFLNQPLTIQGQAIPALGKFMNPFIGFWQNAEATDSRTSQTIDLPKLSEPVEVIYDDKLVPHIFAKNIEDAFMVQGYIEAQHRLWQMDIATRSASGRLSEIMGPKTLSIDKRTRRQGMVFAAKNAISTWKKSPKEFGYVQAYSDGVNAYVNQLKPKDYPVEFKLIGYEPEPWSPLKTALFFKAMAKDLSFRENDLEATNTINAFGRETFDFLYPERNPKESPIIPSSVEYEFEPITTSNSKIENVIGAVYHKPHPKPHRDNGSNNWAIHGSKTASGNPILCNDPHLGLSLPSVWFEIQISAPGYNVYGVSLPGSPGVTLGFNDSAAWGFTNLGHDVLDWYAIKWLDDKKTTYELDGKPVKASIVRETIKVKGQPDIIDTVRYTQWGPVTYESDGHAYRDLAMHWLAHESGSNEVRALYGLNTAKNFDEYFDGIKDFHNPGQNMAFASKDGDIAIKVQGKLPIKTKEQGRFIRDGSKSESGWKGFVPHEQTPYVKNPERGFIASANQFSADTNYPYYYNGGFEDFRGRILNRKLSAMENITPKDMMALQNDNHSLKAEEALPSLLNLVDGMTMTEIEKEAFDLLKKWDYNYDKTKTAPILFDSWYGNFYRKTWDEIYALDEDIHRMLFPEHWRTIALLNDDPENIFFDSKETEDVEETAKEIAISSFKVMIDNFQKWKNQGKTTLEKYNNTYIPHAGRISAFAAIDISAHGTGSALNALRGTHGPSWRLVVELGDEIKAWGVYPAGQSGNPGSPYYDNMIATWANGEYYELLFLKNAKEENSRILYKESFN